MSSTGTKCQVCGKFMDGSQSHIVTANSNTTTMSLIVYYEVPAGEGNNKRKEVKRKFFC